MRSLYLILLVIVCSVCASLGRREGFEECPKQEDDLSLAQRKVHECRCKIIEVKNYIGQLEKDHKNTMVRANQVRDKYNKNGDLLKVYKDKLEQMKKEIDELKPKIPELEQGIEKMKKESESMKSYLSNKTDQKAYPRACW